MIELSNDPDQIVDALATTHAAVQTIDTPVVCVRQARSLHREQKNEHQHHVADHETVDAIDLPVQLGLT